MHKVLVIGCPGAGKSYFSRALAEKTQLPLLPLDCFFHATSSYCDEVDKTLWRQKVADLVAGEQWIIDGNYKGTFDIRLPAADTIIFLDFPRWLVLGRVFKRRIQYHNKRRPDMPDVWREHLNREFLKFIWTYNAVERPKVLALLDGCSKCKSTHILKSPQAACEFLRSV
jgi:adenylate kinase family enzyme